MKVSFSQSNVLTNSVLGTGEKAVSDNLFGAIALSTQPKTGDMNYDTHFEDAFDYLNLHYIRFPDGELPDGFAYKNNSGNWAFAHNGLNNGSAKSYFDPITGKITSNGAQLTQSYLNKLTPAMSLKYDELIHDGLLEQPGRMSFSESLALAADTGSDYALVLPKFEYLKLPYDRQTNANGTKDKFRVADHVFEAEIKADVTAFLDDLFNNKKYNGGVLPSNITFEIGNEDYFGWNSHFFNRDSTQDLDSYSAYAISVLSAVKDFRDDNPGVEFDMAMQAHGKFYVEEIAGNFADAGATKLFGELSEIDAMHFALDATVTSAAKLEENWTITSGAQALAKLIGDNGGDADDVTLSMSAWSANSSDIAGLGLTNHGLPAAGATLSLFSSLIEMGFEAATNWGIGAWGGYGTNASRMDNGSITYAPYIEAYRQMAEALPGTTQFKTTTMDAGRSADYSVYAYADDAKAVLFAAANDFSGRVTIDVKDFGDLGYVWLERISQSKGSDPQTIITREAVTVKDTTLEFTFDAPYETVRIIASREDAGEGYLHLWGLGRDDALTGGTSADLLQGNAGNDTLSGDYGNDTLEGGSGSDKLFGNPGNDRLSGGDGDDLLDGGYGTDTLIGGRGNDVFAVSTMSGNTVIEDFSVGSDRLRLADVVTQFDAVTFSTPTTTLFAASSLKASGSTVAVDAASTSGGTVLTVRSLDNADKTITVTLKGVSLAAFTADLKGNLDFGRPVTFTTYDPLTLQGNLFYAPNEVQRARLEMTAFFESQIIPSTQSDLASFLTLIGASSAVIKPNSGSLPTGNTASTSQAAMPELEELKVANNAVRGTGDANDNSILGNTIGNELNGRDGDDFILGMDGRDTIQGDDGNDRVYGGASNDSILGGNGFDQLVGGAGDDFLIGHRAEDILWGGVGDDTLRGSFGADTLLGQDGDDELHGGSALDTLLGGAGEDTLFGNFGADSLFGGDGDDLLWGGSGIDTLFGGTGNDTLYGMTGADSMSGDKGNDSLLGGTGDDFLDGGDGKDTIFGGQGVDTLYGGAGDDFLRGGTLADSFVFNAGHDRIDDFREEEDKLYLSSDLWTGTLSAQQVIDRFGKTQNSEYVLDFGKGDKITFTEDINEALLVDMTYIY